MSLPPPTSTLFPYTTLFRSGETMAGQGVRQCCNRAASVDAGNEVVDGDRKSTRLNSSHRCISYAVFCLKKKKNNKEEAEDLANKIIVDIHAQTDSLYDSVQI